MNNQVIKVDNKVNNGVFNNSIIDNIVNIHGKKVLFLETAIATGILPDPNSADIWVVNHNDPKLVKKFLYKIILSNDFKTYLKPIFLQKEFKKLYLHHVDILKNLSDGYIKGFNLIDKLLYVETINNYIEVNVDKYENFDKDSNEFFSIKILDYYYSRKKTIKPVINRKSLTGYYYPRIEGLFFNKKEAYSRSRIILKDLFLKGLLVRDYVDTTHLCKNCDSGFLNFREICPKCSDHNLRARNIIHHFRCAYVGSEKDFVVKDKFICPKCASELKNIGVDYDKPGKIFICKNKKCNHEFQDAPIGVHCIDCRTEQTPEELAVKKIYQYELTNLGIQYLLEK